MNELDQLMEDDKWRRNTLEEYLQALACESDSRLSRAEHSLIRLLGAEAPPEDKLTYIKRLVIERWTMLLPSQRKTVDKFISLYIGIELEYYDSEWDVHSEMIDGVLYRYESNEEKEEEEIAA